MFTALALTTSSARCFRTCARQYQYRYVERYKSVARPSYFAFGTYVHDKLDQFYTGKNIEVFSEAYYDLSGEDLARACALAWSYRSHYASDLESWGMPVAEEEFRHDELDYTLLGKVDLVIVDKSGKKWLVEHKTMGTMLSDDAIALLKFDPQVMNYLLAHPSAKGLIYNILVKPKHRPKVDEALEDFQNRVEKAILSEPEKYFKRIVIEREEVDLGLAQEMNDDVAEAIAHAQKRGSWPRNPYACNRFGEICEFADVCHGKISLEACDKVKRSDKVHLELMEEPEGIVL